MKLLFILFFSLPLFSQSYRIPPFSFSSETSKPNEYINFLKLEDENSLIFRVQYLGNGEQELFLVYQNGGKVSTYKVDYSGNESKILKKKVDESLLQNYWEFLYNCSRTNRYKIDQSKLYEPKNSKIIILDGTTYTLEIIQGRKLSSVWSSSPDAYIETKEDGYEEKQKFWELIVCLQNLILEK